MCKHILLSSKNHLLGLSWKSISIRRQTWPEIHRFACKRTLYMMTDETGQTQHRCTPHNSYTEDITSNLITAHESPPEPTCQREKILQNTGIILRHTLFMRSNKWIWGLFKWIINVSLKNTSWYVYNVYKCMYINKSWQLKINL